MILNHLLGRFQLMFIFYMNDIVENLFFVKLSMYADDCVLYMSGNNWENIRKKIQEDLDCFEHWGELNNLHLNVTKTKILVVGSRSELSRLDNIRPIRVYDKDVHLVKQYNYLGVILDSEMTLRPFYNHAKKIVHSKLYTFHKIRNLLRIDNGDFCVIGLRLTFL